MKLTSRGTKNDSKKMARKLEGKAIGFRVDEVYLPDRRVRTREYITHPGAVGVLAFEAPNKIILVKQFSVIRWMNLRSEIPAGKLAKGEEIRWIVYVRELEEETGFVARKIRERCCLAAPTARLFHKEVIHLYIAEGLRPTQMNPDDDELIELVRVSPKQARRSMIQRGKIR